MATPQNLMNELAALAHNSGGPLAWFADQMQGLPDVQFEPETLPVCALLTGALELASTQTRPVVQTVIDAIPALHWQQSYNRIDGFSKTYLDTYGWCNLVSPEGVFSSETIRVTIGYWGKGLNYREHWHEPEEFYLVLAGEAEFHSHGHTPRQCSPGDVIHHRSNQPHAINMTPGPLLAAAFWRGEGLLRKSSFRKPE